MNSKIFAAQSQHSKVRDLVETSLLIAMVFVATRFINVRLPISLKGGLIHLGTGMLYIAAMVCGRKKGAAAGAIGMALFDIVSGWAAWAPFTFIVRGVMGYIVGSIADIKGRDGKNPAFNLLALLAGGLWMIIGYYLTEVVLYGNWITPMTSVPGNIMQIVLGSVALAIVPVLKKLRIS